MYSRRGCKGRCLHEGRHADGKSCLLQLLQIHSLLVPLALCNICEEVLEIVVPAGLDHVQHRAAAQIEGGCLVGRQHLEVKARRPVEVDAALALSPVVVEEHVHWH